MSWRPRQLISHAASPLASAPCLAKPREEAVASQGLLRVRRPVRVVTGCALLQELAAQTSWLRTYSSFNVYTTRARRQALYAQLSRLALRSGRLFPMPRWQNGYGKRRGVQCDGRPPFACCLMAAKQPRL